MSVQRIERVPVDQPARLIKGALLLRTGVILTNVPHHLEQ
jgi:hypothetical protein